MKNMERGHKQDIENSEISRQMQQRLRDAERAAKGLANEKAPTPPTPMTPKGVASEEAGSKLHQQEGTYDPMEDIDTILRRSPSMSSEELSNWQGWFSLTRWGVGVGLGAV